MSSSRKKKSPKKPKSTIGKGEEFVAPKTTDEAVAELLNMYEYDSAFVVLDATGCDISWDESVENAIDSTTQREDQFMFIAFSDTWGGTADIRVKTYEIKNLFACEVRCYGGDPGNLGWETVSFISKTQENVVRFAREVGEKIIPSRENQIRITNNFN